jgi:hypothetical protein
VRTLWRREPYAAGSYTVNWDGKDDAGTTLAAGQFQIKLLYHNVRYVWEGAIANTSQLQSGPHVYNGYMPVRDMAAIDTAMFMVAGYNEGQYSLRRFPHANPGYPTNVGRVDAYTSFSLVDSDGTNVYMANNEGGVNSGNTTSFIYALKARDNSQVAFSAGQTLRLNGNYPDQTYNSVIDLDQNSTPPNSVGFTVLPNAATGLAVQKSGTILAVAHRGQNVIRLFDKTSGTLLRTISASRPGSLSMSPNGDLWAIVGGNVVRYTNLSSNPTIATTITGFANPLALANDPTTDDLVLVADGGSSQQVKAYNRSGSAQWTYGQQGGYPANGNEVRNDKFWFNQSYLSETTFITVAPDRSFWVGDIGNNRCLHFSANRSYINQIMFQAHTYAASVDANDPTRVFSDFMEYKVDYSRPVADSWTLVRNWRVGLDAKYLGFGQGVQQVTTFPNGRTYALVAQPNIFYPELVELTGTKLRSTGIMPTKNYDSGSVTIQPDGSLAIAPYNPSANGTATWLLRTLTGYDATGNPQWSTPAPLASAPTGSQDPYPRPGGAAGVRTPRTSTGLIISFDNSKNNNFHLGAIKVGGNGWAWKASPTGALDGKGSYDIGNGVQYAGNLVQTAGRNIVYGYHGEFWGGAQASQWMHFYDNGLVVGQFGETTVGRMASEGVLAGTAGNGLSPCMVMQNGETYLWSNDEGGHGPIRWHLVGANSIQEATGTGALNSTITLSTPAVAFPTQVVATPGNAQLQLSWNTVSGAAGYTVRYARTSGGPYTTAATGLTANSYTLGSLQNGTSYYVVVDAKAASGTSATSDEITATPYDPAATVQATGTASSNYTELLVNSAAPAAGKPALQVTQPLRYSSDGETLQLDGVGSKGYVLYNWGGVTVPDKLIGFDKINLPSSTFIVTKGLGWRNDNYLKYIFKVDGTSGSDYGLYSNPTGRINIVVNDKNWHYVTAFCPVRFAEARSFRISLTPLGQNTPAATYVVNEDLGKNHVFQFRFKGSVTLTVDNQGGVGGTLQALFFDDEVVASPIASAAVAAAAPQLASLTLVNADNGQDIKNLVDGETLNLATLPTRNLSIRANTSPAQIGSVLFNLSGTQTKTVTENTAPYTLFGDSNGSYTPWPSIATGSYSLKATPYSGSGNTGTAGTPLTVSFTITNINYFAAPQALYRINAGGGQVATSLGTFQADKGYDPAPGLTAVTTAAIAGTSDGALYQDERRSNSRFSYNLSVANGRYTIILHFAETQWQAAGKRQFDVTIEGKKVLDNYDIYRKVGANTATTETFVTDVTDGLLSINFSALASDGGIDQASLAALQVLSSTSGTLMGSRLSLATTDAATSTAAPTAYPNPTADGNLTLALPAATVGTLHYRLVSTTGKVVAAASVEVADPAAPVALNLSAALGVPGIYYLQLHQDTWAATLKVSYTGK